MSILPPALYAELEPAYANGSDPAWHLPQQELPISVTDEEGRLIYRAIRDYDLREGYEVATGFGMSSFYTGLAFKATGGRLISIDSYVEEAHLDATEQHGSSLPIWEPRGLTFAMRWRDRLGLPVRYAIACSPIDVPAVLADRRPDFVFIDGFHHGEQPTQDVMAVLPFLQERCLLAFHDTQFEAVRRATAFACHTIGGVRVEHQTRHNLTFVLRGIE